MGSCRSKYRSRAEVAQARRLRVLREKSRKVRASHRRLQSERYILALEQQTTSSDEISANKSGPSRLTDSFRMAVARDARELAYAVNDLTCGRGLEYQRAVLDKFLEEPVLKRALPDDIVQRQENLNCRIVCNGLADAWTELKFGVGRDRRLARNVLEAAVISVRDNMAAEAAAKCIGLNRRTIRRALSRRRSLHHREHGAVWAKGDRKKRSDTLPEGTANAVVAWWREETRVSSQKKDVQRKRVGVKKFISHEGHWLEESQLDFYSRFKAAHIGLKLGNTSCDCGCEAVCCNTVTSSDQVGVVTCQVKQHVYKRATHLWEQSLCPRPQDSQWHCMKCVRGECTECGFHLIPLCDKEFDPTSSSLLDWRRFEMVEAGVNKKGDPKKVVRLEYKRTSARTFLEHGASKMAPFVLHQHTAKWQDNEFKACANTLQPREIMSLVDFAENYSFRGQDEIQSQHWFNFQITILVHIMYSVNPGFNPHDSKSKRLNTAYNYYVSDDRKHDSLFVQHCLTLHWRCLKESGVTPTRHVVWSDGCAAQFKCATAWYFVARYPSLTVCESLPKGCVLDWHFWGTGHGKGPHDGAGACLKQSIRKEQLRPGSRQLHCAADVVNYLMTAMDQPNAAYPAAKRVVERHFHLIGKTEVSRANSMDAKTIDGSRSMHSIQSVSSSNKVLLQGRNYSCFCGVCVRNEPGRCHNATHVQPWRLMTLEPVDAVEAVEEEDLDQDWLVDGDSNDLAMELEIGDHFAILVDPDDPQSNGAEFFVLICTKKLYIVEDAIAVDGWGVIVDKNDEVVEGLYYHQQGARLNSYILLERPGPARILSHLVCANQFSMNVQRHRQKGGTAVYKLSDGALQNIQEVIHTRAGVAALESDTSEDELDMDHEDSDNTEFDDDELIM